MKEAFAGFNSSGNKQAGVGEAILNAYSHDSLKTWAERKLQGIQTWIGTYQPISRSHLGWDLGGNELRRFQSFNLLPALGLWVIPLILVPWVAKRKERKTINPNFGAAMFMSLGLIGMTIQLLLMWDTHIMHTYAYSTVACLHLAAVISLANAHRLMQGILSLAMFGWFAVVWVLSPIYDWDNCDLIQAGFILVALAVVGAVVWMVPPRYRPEIHIKGV